MGRAITTFPRTDAAFAAYVGARVAEAKRPEDLAAACRDWYPEVRVTRRHDLASYGPDEVWYVYRDARAFDKEGGDWWTAPGAARVAFGREGRFREANEAAVALAGGDLVGRSLADVRPPEQAGDPDWLWQTIERERAVASVARLRRLDGTERDIEFRAECGPEPGSYVAYWREIEKTDAG